MNKISIQMDLLSEVRTPQQVLNFAVNMERGQANQLEILRAHTSNSSWSEVSFIGNRPRHTRPQRILQQHILPTPPTGKIEPCYKFGQPFIKNHLNMCKAQILLAKYAKRSVISLHYAKHQCPDGENPALSEMKTEATRNNKILRKQEESATYKNNNRKKKRSKKKKRSIPKGHYTSKS